MCKSWIFEISWRRKFLTLDSRVHFSGSNCRDFLITAFTLCVRVWCQKGSVSYLLKWKMSFFTLYRNCKTACHECEIYMLFIIHFKLLACSGHNSWHHSMIVYNKTEVYVKVRSHELPWGCLKYQVILIHQFISWDSEVMQVSLTKSGRSCQKEVVMQKGIGQKALGAAVMICTLRLWWLCTNYKQLWSSKKVYCLLRQRSKV